MKIILTAIGVVFILYGISCFVQSFRREDSAIALKQDKIFEDPKKTSRRLRMMAIFFATVGTIMLFY